MDLDPPHPSEMMGGVEATPISQLHPDISDPASRVVAGVITVTWPYSKVNRSIAFILAEHDVRLRRDRGRLRVEFHGAAGKAIESFGIGAGDRVQISLEGAHWERNQVASKHPVPPLEWQLRFKDLLHMRIRRDESDAIEPIDVDVSAAPGSPESDSDYDLSVLFDPQPQADDFAVPEIPRFASPTKQTGPAFDSGEYASPAYLKRARMSYGSLFEGGFDLFAEEERRRKRRRRRSRFSLNASWRYTSRSPSPQAEQLSDSDSEAVNEVLNEVVNEALNEPEPMETEPPVVESTPRPPMVDQGCQTQELDYSPRMGVQVAAESRLTGAIIQSTPTPIGRYEHPAREGLAPPALSYHRATSPSKDHHPTRDLHYLQSHDHQNHLLPIDANAHHGQFDWLAEQHRHHQQDEAAFHPESMMIDPNLQPLDEQDHYQAQANEATRTREGETPMITPHSSTLTQAESAHIQHAPQSPCPPARAPFDTGLQTTATHDFAQHTPRSPAMEASSPIRHHEHEREHEHGPVAIHDDRGFVQSEADRNHDVDRPGKLDQNAEVGVDDSDNERPGAEDYHYAWGHQGHHGQGSDGGRHENGELDEEDYDEDVEEDYDEEHQEDDFEERRAPGPFGPNTYARSGYYEEDDEDEDEDEEDDDEDEDDDDDEEEEEEEEEDYDMDDSPMPNARPMPRAPQEPVVISLLSDSEDDQDDAVETPRPPIAAPQLSFQDRIRELQQKDKGVVVGENTTEEQRVQEVKAEEEEVEEQTEEEEEESDEEESEVEGAEEAQEYSDEAHDGEGEDEEEEEDGSEAGEVEVEEVDVTEEKAGVEGLQGADGQVRNADESQDEEMEIQEVLEYEQVKVSSLGRQGDQGDEIDEDQAIELETRDTANGHQEVEATNANTANDDQQIDAERLDIASETHEIELKPHDTAEEDVEMGDLPTTEAKGKNEEAAHMDESAIDEAAASHTPMDSPPAVDQEDRQHQRTRHEAVETEATEVNSETRRQGAGQRADVTDLTDLGQEGQAQELETTADAEALAKPGQTMTETVHEARDVQEPELLVTQETFTTKAPPELETSIAKSSNIVEHPGSQTAGIEATTTTTEDDARESDEPVAEDLHVEIEVSRTVETLHESDTSAPRDIHPTTTQESEITLGQPSSNAFLDSEQRISDTVHREYAAADLGSSPSDEALHESAGIVMISEAQAEPSLEKEPGISISQTVQTISSEDVKAMPHVEVASEVEMYEPSDGGIDHMEVEEPETERTENAVEPEDVDMDDGADESSTEAQHVIQEKEVREIVRQDEAARIEEPLSHDGESQNAREQEERYGDAMFADGENPMIQEQALAHVPEPEVMIPFTSEGFNDKGQWPSTEDAQGPDEIRKRRESEDLPSSPKSKVTKSAKGLLPPPIIRPGQPKRKELVEETELAGSDSDEDMSAEQQLMEEFRASQSEHLHPFDDSASRPSYFHSFDGAHDEVQESPTRARPASRPERTDLVITAQSLRSHCRRHRKSMSVESHETMETTYSRPRTPSMKHCLVDEAGTMPSPLWCVTHHGADGHEDDPSVALARSNPVESEDGGAAEDNAGGGGGGVAAARWSILRDRSHAMEDHTVALARSNEQSPEAEHARRRGGSRYASSTGRRSVSPMKLRALRPRGKQADVSVQLAKSNPEEL